MENSSGRLQMQYSATRIPVPAMISRQRSRYSSTLETGEGHVEVVEAAAPAPTGPTLAPGASQQGLLVVFAGLVAETPVVRRWLRAGGRSAELGANPLPACFLRRHSFLEASEEQVESRAVVFLGQVQEGGTHSDGQEFGGGVEALVEAVEGRGGKDAGLGLAEDADGGPGDDAECAFAADEQVVEVGAGGILRHGAGLQDAAVGQHGFEGDYLAAHRPVGRGHVSDAVGGDGPGDGGDGDAVGVVAEHEAVIFQAVNQISDHYPGLYGGGEVSWVYVQDAVHALRTDDEAAPEGQCAAHDAGAAAVGDDGDALPPPRV